MFIIGDILFRRMRIIADNMKISSAADKYKVLYN